MTFSLVRLIALLLCPLACAKNNGPLHVLNMLSGYHPVLQSLMATLLTWGLTAAGSALVFVFQGGQVSL